MIYFKLFYVFFIIGAVSLGGGYGMISLVREQVLLHGWLEDDKLLELIAVSESTPGPIAVNIATFVGSSQGGILGALSATLGVVLPAFIIILLIASLIKDLLKYKGVAAFLDGVKPSVVALIISTSVTMLLSALLKFKVVGDKLSPDFAGIIIFTILVLTAIIYKKIKRQSPSPFTMIIISAVLGIIFYPMF